jgi:hypothetical protein
MRSDGTHERPEAEMKRRLSFGGREMNRVNDTKAQEPSKNTSLNTVFWHEAKRDGIPKEPERIQQTPVQPTTVQREWVPEGNGNSRMG